jgi:hypothetical protein
VSGGREPKPSSHLGLCPALWVPRQLWGTSGLVWRVVLEASRVQSRAGLSLMLTFLFWLQLGSNLQALHLLGRHPTT